MLEVCLLNPHFRAVILGVIIWASFCQPIFAQSEPVTVTLSVTKTKSDAEAEAEVTFRIERDWYVYGRAAGGAAVLQPLYLKLILPSGFEAVGDWEGVQGDLEGFLMGERRIRHTIRVLRVTKDAEIQVDVRYQACSSSYCRPPEYRHLSVIYPDAHGGVTQADMDWAAIEKVTFGPAGAYSSNREDRKWENQAYKDKRFREIYEDQDRRLKAASEMALAFWYKYPTDTRRSQAREKFLQTPPFFVKMFPPAAHPGLIDYVSFGRALVIDDEAMQQWRTTGDEMVAVTTNSATAVREEKEAADYLLFLREWQINANQPMRIADWERQNALFEQHVAKYRGLKDAMTRRAEDYLGGVAQIEKRIGPTALSDFCKRFANSSSEAVRDVSRKLLDEMTAEAADSETADRLTLVCFTALRGENVNLPQMKGKLVYLDFWATWCAPCVAEMPFLKSLYGKYKDAGFEIIGISCDMESQRARLREFLEVNGYDWPQHFDGRGRSNRYSKLFDVKKWPATILIGQDGRIIGKDIRGVDLEAAIQKALRVPD